MKRLYVTLMLIPCFLTLYSQATVEPDYMLLGRETLPLNGQFINDTFVMIDYTKGSLRGGILNNAHFWSPDSVKAGSFGFGVNVLATGNGGTTALGINTWANGNNGATALGTLTRAFGNDGATALGVNSWAYGNNGATALGCFTKATGNNGATTLGFVTLASGSNGATALGSNTIASGNNGATALGAGTKAYGNNGATALGYHTFATGNSCTSMGVFSDSIVTSGTVVTATSPLVIVGNGDLGNPSNALVIRKNGIVSFENYSFPDLDGTMGQVLGTNGSGNLDWVDGDDWSNNASDIFRSTGSVVIGHSGVPLAKLEVNNANLMLPAGIFENTASNNNQAALRAKTSGLWRGGEFEINNAANTAAAIYGLTNGGGTGLVINHNGSGGNLAIFQSSNANMARIDKTGKGYFNGGTVSSGADIAEAMVPEGNVQDYEYGDILVISTNTDRSIEKSKEAYSSLVAGVYATKPGVLLTEENIEHDLTGHIPMGVIGIIPTKVCNEEGPIKRGDLLVTSSRPGVAMKADLSKLQIGQALGKALQNSDVDTDLINVLVNVQ